MKKILTVLLACLLLAGCSSSTPKEEAATCSYAEEGLMTMVVDVKATDDEINAFKMVMTMDKSAFGGIDMSGLDDATKATIEETMLSQLGISNEQDGLSVNVEFTDTMIITVDIDLKTADSAVLKSLGFDFEDTNLSFKDLMADASEDGFECSQN